MSDSQVQRWEVAHALESLGGKVTGTGAAGQMWDLNGQPVAVPWCRNSESVCRWASGNTPMIHRIAVATGQKPWRVFGILTATDPSPEVLAQLVPAETLARAFSAVQGAVLGLRMKAWDKERSGAPSIGWSAVAEMLTDALVEDFDETAQEEQQ